MHRKGVMELEDAQDPSTTSHSCVWMHIRACINIYIYMFYLSYKLGEQDICISVLLLLNSQCLERYPAHKKSSVSNGRINE